MVDSEITTLGPTYQLVELRSITVASTKVQNHSNTPATGRDLVDIAGELHLPLASFMLLSR